LQLPDDSGQLLSSGPIEDREFDPQTDFRRRHYPPVSNKQFISDIDPHANCVSAKADVVKGTCADDLIGVFGTNFNIPETDEPFMLPAIPI
jgi:hypothetical protein